jgi:hypothetical protein
MSKLECPTCGNTDLDELTYKACLITSIVFHDVRVEGDTLFIKENGDCSENQKVFPVMQCQRCDNDFDVPAGLKVEEEEKLK